MNKDGDKAYWQEACKQQIFEIVNLTQHLRVYSLDFIFQKNGLLIALKLDNLASEYGSPSVEDCDEIAKLLRDQVFDKIEDLGGPEKFGIEVSSPGAERQLKNSDEYVRFKNLPMKVSFVDGKVDSKGLPIVVTEVLNFIELRGSETIWKKAILKGKKSINKKKKAKENNFVILQESIKKTNLYLDF